MRKLLLADLSASNTGSDVTGGVGGTTTVNGDTTVDAERPVSDEFICKQ